MIDGTYKIMVDSPLGRKESIIVLETEGDVLRADVDAPVIGKQKMQGHVDGDTFTAHGSTKVLLVGKIDFTIKGEVSGDVLHIDIQSSKGNLELEGVRL